MVIIKNKNKHLSTEGLVYARLYGLLHMTMELTASQLYKHHKHVRVNKCFVYRQIQ